MKILAIETSCDETAAALVEKTLKGVKILSNVVASQIEIHKKYGGVFPEHASRAHAEKIIPVVAQALVCNQTLFACEKQPKGWATTRTVEQASACLGDVDAIAVTTGPGLIGSLLVGVNFAKTYTYANKLPIIGINHWLGHIYSNWTVVSSEVQSESQTPQKAVLGASVESSSLNDERASLPRFPSLILIVSGGHTGLVLMKSHDKIVPLGETLDDAAGEAFDKVAKLLQLGYPGGPAIAEAAAEILNPKSETLNKSKIPNLKLPRSMLDRKDYNFSFSGLKTAVLYLIRRLESQGITINHSVKSQIANEFQQAVIDILIGKTIQAAYQYRPKSTCLCGGVSANKELREQMEKAVSGLPWRPSFHKPHLELTGDNAAMIGVAAAYHLDNMTSWGKINADANLIL